MSIFIVIASFVLGAVVGIFAISLTRIAKDSEDIIFEKGNIKKLINRLIEENVSLGIYPNFYSDGSIRVLFSKDMEKFSQSMPKVYSNEFLNKSDVDFETVLSNDLEEFVNTLKHS